MKVVLVTGGFDPLHSGHIEYFHAAKKLGDILVVGLNSDEWLTRKKGRPFMPFKERSSIINELKVVSNVFQFDDEDDACEDCLSNVLNVSPVRVGLSSQGRRSTPVPISRPVSLECHAPPTATSRWR